MTKIDIAQIRLFSQQLVQAWSSSPAELVAAMGAMQAQDFPMAKWAVGVRQPATSEDFVESAIDKGEILRTHLLRPTWHFVAAQDIYWILDLTARHVMAAQGARERQLELTETVFSLSNTVIGSEVAGGHERTRQELISALQQAGIRTDQNRASHLLARAELEKIICSGPTINGKTTYALLSERVPSARTMTRESALAELARRYFTARCPATMQDFAWWSGLPAREVKLALELVKQDFSPEAIDGVTYWFPRELPGPFSGEIPAFLLPTYDEYIISYSERSAAMERGLEQHLKEISDRGVFRPVILIEGRVQGTWKRTLQKDSVHVEVSPFSQLDDEKTDRLRAAAERYARFLHRTLEFHC